MKSQFLNLDNDEQKFNLNSNSFYYKWVPEN